MKDPEIERRYPWPMYDRRAAIRCQSCGCLPRVLHSTQVLDVRSDRAVYVRACTAHYCRSRAPEFARFE